jgi:hypothetical protein
MSASKASFLNLEGGDPRFFNGELEMKEVLLNLALGDFYFWLGNTGIYS